MELSDIARLAGFLVSRQRHAQWRASAANAKQGVHKPGAQALIRPIRQRCTEP
ncbi:MAG: hypothetical protein V4812_17325 [Pseudomonadota bacterium]